MEESVLLREIMRLYKVSPYRITALWGFDFIETVLAALNPWVIGNCIDTFTVGEYLWLFILIGAELTYMISCAIHRYIDTRLYNQIVEEESCRYYERIVKSDESDSTISSRLNLIDDLPDFILIGIPQVVSVIVGILFSLIMLFRESGSIAFLLAVVMTAFVPVITRKEKCFY